jgi:antibiotic biosynthesis monooxygenase (ABM) superfamily enzyme
MKPPPKWKTAILVWVCIYPSITTLFLLFGNQLMALHPMVRTLVLTLILVPLLVFVLLPLMQKLFGGWLHR